MYWYQFKKKNLFHLIPAVRYFLSFFWNAEPDIRYRYIRCISTLRKTFPITGTLTVICCCSGLGVRQVVRGPNEDYRDVAKKMLWSRYNDR
jgi:hypothetical protein